MKQFVLVNLGGVLAQKLAARPAHGQSAENEQEYDSAYYV
jgi:hypothetical protein